ncbi:MAG: hypothetical protein LBF28_00990 [Rickettsiales bacterium]|jgi:hypothetical protein|nr:hypothetical protein [Rickettsiales bacterium]
MTPSKSISSIDQFEKAWAMDFRKTFDSSAENLEKLLSKKMIQLPFKLFYRYTLPDNKQPQEFEKELKNVWGYLIFDKYKTINGLSIIPETKNALKQMRAKYSVLLKTWVSDIKAKNPKLASISVRNRNEELNFVDGACYGYGPEEIQFFLERKRSGEGTEPYLSSDQIEKLKSYLGDSPNYILTPKHLSSLMTAVENRINPKTDAFGCLDPSGYLRFMEEKVYGD